MMKRSYLSGLLVAILMMVCSVSLASESLSSGFVPAFEIVVMDAGQPVTVADLASAHEQSDSADILYNTTDKNLIVDSFKCRSSSGGIVLVACNTGKVIDKPASKAYAMIPRSTATPTKIPI